MALLTGEAPDGRLFAVFERVQGRTLHDRLAMEGLSAVDTGRLMTEVLDALAAAHRRGIVHRDLKPQNIVLVMADDGPHVKLLDFGIGALLPGATEIAPRPRRSRPRCSARRHIARPSNCATNRRRPEVTCMRGAWS